MRTRSGIAAGAAAALALVSAGAEAGQTFEAVKRKGFVQCGVIVRQVGNYGESFERNVGGGSPLRIARGVNALWKNDGLQYSPPFR